MPSARARTARARGARRGSPDPRYARRLPWVHRGEVEFFARHAVDSAAFLALPALLVLWARRWRSRRILWLLLPHGAIVAAALWLGLLPATSTLGFEAFFYSARFSEMLPFPGPSSVPARVLIGLPPLVLGVLVVSSLARLRWRAVAASLGGTLALAALLGALLVALDDRDPVESYAVAGWHLVALQAAWPVGLLVLVALLARIAYRLFLRLARRAARAA